MKKQVSQKIAVCGNKVKCFVARNKPVGTTRWHHQVFVVVGRQKILQQYVNTVARSYDYNVALGNKSCVGFHGQQRCRSTATKVLSHLGENELNLRLLACGQIVGLVNIELVSTNIVDRRNMSKKFV